MVWKRLYTLVAAVVFTIALAIFAVGTNYISDVWASLPGTNFTGDVNVDGNLTLTTPCANGYALDGTTTCAYTGTYDGDLNQDGMGKNSTNWTQMSTEDFITKGPVIDIRSYGAIANDGLGDTEYFQDILDEYNTGSIAIYIPCGEFTWDRQLNFTSSHQKITIFGNGDCSILKLGNNVNKDFFSMSGADYITFRNFQIDGNNANNNVAGYVVKTGWNSWYYLYDGIYIHDTTGNAIAHNGDKDIKIINSRFVNIGESGISASNYGFPISANSVEGMIVENNYFNTWYGAGAVLFSDTSSASGNRMYGGIISNNVFRNAQVEGGSNIHLLDSFVTSITGNTIYDTKINPAQGINGIFVSGGFDYTIANNNIYNITGVGIETNTVSRANVNNNIIVTYLNGTDSNGISSSCSYCIIDSNFIEGSAHHGVATHGNYTIISNNIIKNIGLFSDSGMIRLVTSTASGNITGMSILNNKFINTDTTYNATGIFITETNDKQFTNLTMSGNLFYNIEEEFFSGTITYKSRPLGRITITDSDGTALGCIGSCETGQLGWNTTHICVCTTTNTWKRAALS